MHISKITPYTSGTVMFQPMEWLEAGFRYTDVANRLYGPLIAGDQSYKDKSIDVKVRLRKETSAWPQIAVGLRDLGGTGLFSSEYIVANKRWGNWDASLGLGWGYMAGRGDVRNPLSIFGTSYSNRAAPDVGLGGVVNSQSMFHGSTAFFGGIQWHTPYSPWSLKLELDGNDYQHEPQNNNQTTKSPFNLGATYRYSPGVDLSFGIERGNSLMFGVTFHGALNSLSAPKLLDPVPPAVSPLGGFVASAFDDKGTVKAIELHTGWSIRAMTHSATATSVLAESDTAAHLQERIDRVVAILHRDSPASSTHFLIELQERGLPMSQVRIDRAEWVALRTVAQPPSMRLPPQEVLPGQTSVLKPSPAVGWNNDFGLSFSHILGGPNSFLLYQLGLEADLEKRFSENTWFNSTFNYRALDNYNTFVYDAPSNLPRVRTGMREYATTSAVTMPLLQLTHARDVGNGHYGSVYAGMLESMFGGVGMEWLYRPWQSRLAWGADINHVRQRDFRQDLAFRDYQVNTGHATMYWDTGWNDIQANLSVGKYLAADVGATLEIKRTFSNGVVAGVFATKTNVSAEVFGEGSFDKGAYVTIPWDVFLPKSSSLNSVVVWKPLTRDGGARLSRRFSLDGLTRQRDRQAFKRRSVEPTTARSAQDLGYVLHDDAPTMFDRLGDTSIELGHQIANIPATSWAWAGGAVLASTLLDKPLSNWAANNQSGTAQSVGNASSNMPLAMAIGTGLLYAGIGGESAASTAEVAFAASAYTYGANLLTRFAIGRSRPFEEKGSGSFNGFTSEAVQSGFASNHVAIAFALATPFAQRHDMPWLYGLAAATAFGRVQQREHWASDTAAGAMMGYAIGSLLTNQSTDSRRLQLNVTPQSVAAKWTFK
jgi:membrane-associated phospholipid phosphatase